MSKYGAGIDGNIDIKQYMSEANVYPDKLNKIGSFVPFLSTNGP